MKIDAIVISTVYPSQLDRCGIWNEEIQDDAKTIQEVFPYRLELIIPAGKLPKQVVGHQIRKIREMVAALIAHGETTTNIILNTHGAPGSHDIDNKIIIELVKYLSLKNIKINTIYALLCNGFDDKPGPRDIKWNLAMGGYKAPQKGLSSMRALQGQLQKLELPTPQRFEIKGFRRAYDPKNDKLDVLSLLRGHAEENTLVSIGQVSQENYNTIWEHINTCRKKDCSTPETKRNYEMAGNALAKVLHKMNENIDNYLCGNDQLNPSSVALYESVKSFAELKDIPTTIFFYNAYQQWKKVYKSYDEERLKVLTAYCEVNTHIELGQEAISPQQHHSVFEWAPTHGRRIGFFSKDVSSSPLLLAEEQNEFEYNLDAFFSQKSPNYSVQSTGVPELAPNPAKIFG